MKDGTLSIKKGTVATTGMRLHELALQAWLNKYFTLAEGIPVPVVFSSPMDAFSRFRDLLQNSPELQKMYTAKDEEGLPYMAYPEQMAFPLISVMRKNWVYRPYQNFSLAQWRNVNWPTVSDNVSREQLGNVTVTGMPMAYDYKFQIDFYCLRPDTQAIFVERLMRAFWATSGNQQTWLPVDYPGWGRKLVRAYSEGDISNSTPEEPEAGKIQQFRTTFQLTVEGWSLDIDYKVVPALWSLLVNNSDPATPQDFQMLSEVDLRIQNNNTVVNRRNDIPANDPVFQKTGQLPAVPLSLGGTPVATPNPVYVAPINSAIPAGIAPEEAIGVPTMVIGS